MSLYNVPEVLKQKLVEVEGTSKITSPQTSLEENLRITHKNESMSFENGRFLLWKGVETGFFYRTAHPSPGSLTIYDYKNGTANTMLLFSHQFGHTALIVDAIYFPLSADHPGIVVAVTDRSMDKNGDYLAVFSLLSHSLLNAFYVQYPITSIYSILDGSAERAQFLRLSSSFHKDWPHILLVGCRYGYVTLVYFDLQIEKISSQKSLNSPSATLGNKTEDILPIRCKKNVHLTKIFYEDQMFVFRADDGTTKCLTKEKVSVSALHWEEKCGLVFVGFNFGGVMAVSLRTSKVFSLLYIDGTVLHFASQEPEEDPRPILFLWIAFSSLRTGTSLLLCNINFPKDEERKKLSPDGAEHYTYLEPQFMPYMKWPLDSCSRLYTMRTIQVQKGIASGGGDSDLFPGEASTLTELGHKTKVDTSLLFVAWSEQQHGQMRINGSLFDLNAFYAKRLIPKIQPDSTIARQIPFISRFSARELASTHQPLLDIMPSAVYRFSALALLNESIDQLYYPSTFHLKNTTLTSTRIFQTEVQPIQVQLVNELSQNFVSYFENPKQCVGWIHAIGLANSAPSANINEERVCLLRVVVHNFFPGIVSLIETSASNTELLKFIQKWMWKELEITKAKFDELCSPIFANPPHDLSPNSQGYVQHARLFFKRASIVFRLIHSAVEQSNDQDWIRSIIVQETTVRQVRLYSACIAFGLLYKLLPIDPVNIRLYSAVTEQFARRVERLNKFGRKPQIHKLIGQIIELNKENELWQGKTAEWYPPKDFTSLLPILLFVNVSEAAKTELIGYYCLDLETSAATFSSTVEVKDGSTPPSYSTRLLRRRDDPPNSFRNCKFFALFISVLSEENLSSEEMDRLRVLWSEDKLLAEVNSEAENLLISSFDSIPKHNPPSRVDIGQLKEELLQTDWGLYKFNQLMLERGHFDLLLDIPSLKGNEPEFVQKCHCRCLDVKRRFPTLFRKRITLPPSVVDHFREKCTRRNNNWHLLPPQQSESVQQCQLVMPVGKHSAVPLHKQQFARPKTSRDKMERFETISHKQTISMTNGEENTADYETLEELPLTIATPRRTERSVFFEKQTPTNANATVVIEQQPPFEEQPKTPTSTPIAGTPRQPNEGMSPVECNIIQKGSVKAKDWDRIVKITQTPLSLRKSIGESNKYPLRQQRSFERARTLLFPAEAAPQKIGNKIVTRSVAKKMERGGGVENRQNTPPQLRMDEDDQNEQDRLISPMPNMNKSVLPLSILKSDRKRSRLPTDSLSSKPRLRFAQALFTTEQIPSRAEKAMDQETSFSNFASLSGSESPASSSKSLGLTISSFSGTLEERESRPKKSKLSVGLFSNADPSPSC